jgi:SET domain-containing protein 6
MLLECSQADSKCAPYFAVLPRQLNNLIFWSQAELAELQASTVLKKIGKTNAEEAFSKYIAPLGLKNSDTDNCHRIASIIMAYAFDIPEQDHVAGTAVNEQVEDELVSDDGEDEKTILSMIPLADMLNANAERNNAKLCCDKQDLEMRTTRPIKEGEEILNDYGQLPRSDLLRRYGYVTDLYAIYDVAEVSTELVLSMFRSGGKNPVPGIQLNDEDLANRMELAQREDIYDDSYDVIRVEFGGTSIPDELLALLYLLLLDNESLAQISNSQTQLPGRSKLETGFIGICLVALLQLREHEYATTLEEDETLLAEEQSYRTRLAIQVRLGEKKVLREAIQEARSFAGSNQRMRGLRSSSGQTGGAKAKRSIDEISTPSKKGRFR